MENRCALSLCAILCDRYVFNLSAVTAIAGNGTPDVYKILGGARTRQEDYDYSYMNNDIKDAENQGDNLYIGRSGDPWSTPSTRDYDKDIFVHVSSQLDTALNNTRARSIA